MDRQRLNTAGLALIVLTLALVTGCAGVQPRSDGPAGPPVVDAGEPAGGGADDEAGREPQPGTSAPPQADASAPTLALLRQSERSAESGDLGGAIAYVERAIRLNSRDAELWLRLARLQLAAERPGRAEQLAQKAIALAGDASDEQRAGWLVVADALEAQGDQEAAARIRARWRTYRG